MRSNWAKAVFAPKKRGVPTQKCIHIMRQTETPMQAVFKEGKENVKKCLPG